MTSSPLPPVDPRHRRAIELRLAGATTQEVADALGVNETTVRRWFRRPEVRAEFEAIQWELREEVRSDARSLARDVLATIREHVRENPWLALQVADRLGLLEPATPPLPLNLLPPEAEPDPVARENGDDDPEV